MMARTAAERWRQALAAWALPDSILLAATESPWIHPPELFGVPDVIDATPSHSRALEALSIGGVVLDVGCGGGVAAYALTPPAKRVIGVDSQAAMLQMFQRGAERRGVACEVIEGLWPEVADRTPIADVVTAHHVAYNVGDVVAFLAALGTHARHRVVLELPDRHPLTPMSDAWRHFWQLERPTEPTPRLLCEVLAEMGIEAHREQWTSGGRAPIEPRLAAHVMRVRLCLAPEREPEVEEFMRSHPEPPIRELSTVWWDV